MFALKMVDETSVKIVLWPVEQRNGPVRLVSITKIQYNNNSNNSSNKISCNNNISIFTLLEIGQLN